MYSSHANNKFYLSLLEFVTNVKQYVISIGSEFGLTSIQVMTLLLLDEAMPRPMKNFCTLFHCDASNVTGIIDGLERKGLVSRQSDPHDRRIKVIQVEPEGIKMRETILDRLAQYDDYIFGALTAAETEQLVRIVEKLAASKCLAEN
jgi:DNA-binding MarR family transcriptional regulator